MTAPLDVDNFAGGGGASLGISTAFNKPIDIAVNHDAEALAMHAANHPETLHLREDVWQVKPKAVCKGRPVRVAWFSPDCTHHSKAKGGKPREKRIRGLCWVAVRWARDVKPLCIMLENVEEFQDYGPLDKTGHPIKARKGEMFRRFVRALRRLGYKVEWRVLVAADYGAPTIRKRLYLVARCDGQPIVWPEPTHAKNPEAGLFTTHLKRWRGAHECIDWSIPCPSIFERKKPLAENTLKRIAEGLRRYVIECADPFVVAYAHGTGAPYIVKPNHAYEWFRGQSLEQPLPTQTQENQFALVTPYLSGIDNKSSGAGAVWPAGEPLRTTTMENRFALVAPSLVQTGYGEREGQSPRALDIEQPLGTVVATGKHALVSAFLAKHYGGVVGQDAGNPLGTVTAVDHHSLVAAHLEVMYSNSKGADLREPMPTVTAQAGHIAEVRAFLTKCYGTGNGSSLREPMGTVTSKDRMGLVVIHGLPYQIADIGLRMLQPRELARAQGFPDTYILTGTKTSQVARIGNSVCPDVAEALVSANFPNVVRFRKPRKIQKQRRTAA